MDTSGEAERLNGRQSCSLMDMALSNTQAYRQWSAVLFVTGLILSGACRTGVPVIDPNARPPEPRATVSGNVRSTSGDALAGRQIVLVNKDTGERYEARTIETGGYTIQLPAGKYTAQLELRSGESLQKGPKEITLAKSDLDSRRDFIVAPTAARSR